MRLANSNQLRHNQKSMKQPIRIFFLVAFLLTAVFPAVGYVPEPDRIGVFEGIDFSNASQLESIPEISFVTLSISEWSSGQSFSWGFTIGTGNPKTHVPGFMYRWVGCNGNPVNFVDPTGKGLIPFRAAHTKPEETKEIFEHPYSWWMPDWAPGWIRGTAEFFEPSPGEQMFSLAAPIAVVTGPSQKIVSKTLNKASELISDASKLLSKGEWKANAGGFIRSFVTERTERYYRVYSGNKRIGGFLTKLKPKNRKFAQESLSLPLDNTAEFIQEVIVPAGTRMQRSRALSAFRPRGGAEQFELLDFIDTCNFGLGRKFE